jgi:hypothetical protein
VTLAPDHIGQLRGMARGGDAYAIGKLAEHGIPIDPKHESGGALRDASVQAVPQVGAQPAPQVAASSPRPALAPDTHKDVADIDAALAALDLFHPNDWRQILYFEADGKPPHAKSFKHDDIKGQRKALEYIAANGFKSYFNPNPLKSMLNKKATKDNVLEARWLWVDLDPRANEPLDDERRTMLALLTTNLPEGIDPPDIIIDSGRGYWGFWKISEPQPLDGKDGPLTKEVEGAAKQLANAFGDRFADACHNVERIARLPGLINPKTGKLARVLHGN